ncbi:AAA family ATPase [Aureimonas psammosilenae]|uniref:AAA family ATPase n=1 Tax=Aureimonas psammosilenae TaxID=2495496 RepID=UPI0012605BCE|nr:AAA family ATPase [Aureimonas psammosilenae]
MPRGLVLAGPPGTGKTLFARSFARSAGLPLVIGSLAQWQSTGDGHLGDCLSAMKKCFSDARAAAPSILFIDELYGIGDREAFHPRARDYGAQVVNGLLEELDGASDRTGVVVLAATNHVSRIDKAILRPGRLDRVARIEMPDVPALVGILRTQLGDDLPSADLLPIALAGRGGSGASVASWVRQARGTARRAGRGIEVADLLAAVREGRVQVPADERRRIAIHEAAHACAAVACSIGTVHALTIHDTGGVTQLIPTARTTTRSEVMGIVVYLLAGRAAEKAFLGSISAGAGGSATSDLALATRAAFGIEASWGLDTLGPMWLGDPEQDFTMLACVPGFAASARDLLLRCEAEADRLVTQNEAAIRRCAERLFDAGHLDAEAVLEALGPIPPFRTADLDRTGAGTHSG